MRATCLLLLMMTSLSLLACGSSGSADPSSPCGAPSKVQYSTTPLDGGSAPTCDAEQAFGVTLEGDYPIGTTATLPMCSVRQCFCQKNSFADAGGTWNCPL